MFYVCFDQMQNNLISQAGQMETNGTPNDLLPAMNQVGCIVLGPLTQELLYPFLHRRRVYLTAVSRIAVGFAFVALSMCARALAGPFLTALYSKDGRRSDAGANLSALVVVGFILSGTLAITLLGFIVVHSYLLLHGATTIECHQYGRAFPFNQGWWKNLEVVLGETTTDRLLPTTPSPKQQYVLHPAELEHLAADSCFDDSSDQEDDRLL